MKKSIGSIGETGSRSVEMSLGVIERKMDMKTGAVKSMSTRVTIRKKKKKRNIAHHLDSLVDSALALEMDANALLIQH